MIQSTFRNFKELRPVTVMKNYLLACPSDQHPTIHFPIMWRHSI